MKRFLKPGWFVVYFILFVRILRIIFVTPTYTIDDTFRIAEGETIAPIYASLGWWDTIRVKRYMKQHSDQTAKIQPGSYVFSGAYTAAEILEVFLSGPQLVYERLTILEGWGIYDTDAYLANKGYIQTGEYIDVVTDPSFIDTYRQRYPFLQQAFDERDTIVSLEGYLYPETYFVDLDKDIIDQLVYLQLESFEQAIWVPYGADILSLSTKLRDAGYNFALSSYGALILASIVEKEERIDANKPAITSIFYNRLDTGMQIDADISLCYGLAEGYESCTPSIIVEHLTDKTNPYNTRAVGGLPPTPIASPTASSVEALFLASPSNNFFYLHAPDGTLHTAVDIAGHNANKVRYLQ